MHDLPPQHLQMYDESLLSSATDILHQLESGISSLINQITSQFPNGLKWGDLPQLFQCTLSVIDQLKDAHAQQISALYLVDQVIDVTDTPFLPDAATDPILKAMMHSLIFYYFSHDDLAPNGVMSAAQNRDISSVALPSDEQIKGYAEQLKGVFHDQFQPKDITAMIALCDQFTNQFPGLTLTEKRQCIILIVDDFIDMTDTPYLPDSLIDPLIKKIVPSFVNFLVH